MFPFWIIQIKNGKNMQSASFLTRRFENGHDLTVQQLKQVYSGYTPMTHVSEVAHKYKVGTHVYAVPEAAREDKRRDFQQTKVHLAFPLKECADFFKLPCAAQFGAIL